MSVWNSFKEYLFDTARIGDQLDTTAAEQNIRRNIYLDANRSEPTHRVTVEKDSTLFNIYKEEKLYVNSFHHQAVGDAGPLFRVTATASDSTIEAIESAEYKSILGVQWHPECLVEGLPLFKWLINEATAYRNTCDMHSRVLTLDTHCDTPMFFPKGVDFGSRDRQLLVDL
ncbi:MAG: gamma-glutamyl-gamma-aminobutyrate hydrolase family protein, partial [Bacteroidales bacterium]|nr:gamma-glutamyl-gamma-aminobutyrate hydrolase family protein [Bacteroidales bacterium]